MDPWRFRIQRWRIDPCFTGHRHYFSDIGFDKKGLMSFFVKILSTSVSVSLKMADILNELKFLL
jgi:hypothetical protein